MSLGIVFTDDFPADVATQARWYARQRDEDLALDYAQAVEATLELLAEHPQLGSPCHYPEPQLAGLRFYPAAKPFQRHLIYYPKNGVERFWLRVERGDQRLASKRTLIFRVNVSSNASVCQPPLNSQLSTLNAVSRTIALQTKSLPHSGSSPVPATCRAACSIHPARSEPPSAEARP